MSDENVLRSTIWEYPPVMQFSRSKTGICSIYVNSTIILTNSCENKETRRNILNVTEIKVFLKFHCMLNLVQQIN